ncbi:MAG: NAD(+) synthase [Lachnospirales bacterium]
MENIELIVNDICKWIVDIKETSSSKGFVLGISGGKDSAVVAGLLVKAVGKENVLGVMMPNDIQPDISDSEQVCKDLGIPHITVNINDAYKGLVGNLPELNNKETSINIQPRLRMTVLYALAQEKGYLVCGTGNRSESYIGYCTKWGDTASDLNPIFSFNTEEVIAIGDYLGVTKSVVHKTPTDGLSGKSDEEKIGFTYEELNSYIATGMITDSTKKEKIDKMHKTSRHKVEPIPTFKRIK